MMTVRILGGRGVNLNTPGIGRWAVHFGYVRSDWAVIFDRLCGHFYFCKIAHVSGFGAVFDCDFMDSVLAAELAAVESDSLRAVWHFLGFARSGGVWALSARAAGTLESATLS